METSTPKPKMKFWKKALITVGVIWVGTTVLAILAVSVNTPPAPAATPTPPGSAAVRTASAAPTPVASPLPDAEQWFVNTVTAFRGRYQGAANDMAKGAVRVARGHALCDPKETIRARQGVVTDWIGKVSDLDSVGDGRGILVVRLAPHITLGTTNNTLSEGISDNKTLIPVGSNAYKAAVATHVGERVVFSGTMFSSKTDCAEEQSATMDGSMTDPEFLFRFTAVRAAH